MACKTWTSGELATAVGGHGSDDQQVLDLELVVARFVVGKAMVNEMAKGFKGCLSTVDLEKF